MGATVAVEVTSVATAAVAVVVTAVVVTAAVVTAAVVTAAVVTAAVVTAAVVAAAVVAAAVVTVAALVLSLGFALVFAASHSAGAAVLGSPGRPCGYFFQNSSLPRNGALANIGPSRRPRQRFAPPSKGLSAGLDL
jgi:ABC-type multidrug transport system permease subunit